MRRLQIPGAVLALMAVVALACGGGQSSSGVDAFAETQAAAQAVLQMTQDAISSGAAPGVQTAAAQATEVAGQVALTQAAVGEQSAAQAQQTAEAIAPMLAELPTFGVNPASEGQPGWVHPPASLDVEGYLQYDYTNRFLATVAKDQVMATDLTWNTFTGLAGCGFLMRSDGDEEAMNAYMFIASRGGNGRVGFFTLNEGELVDGQDVNFSTGLNWRNDESNRIAIVARGNQFTVFANGNNIGTVEPKPEYQYDRGFSALVALSESGLTHCEFNNTYLYILDN